MLPGPFGWDTLSQDAAAEAAYERSLLEEEKAAMPDFVKIGDIGVDEDVCTLVGLVVNQCCCAFASRICTTHLIC